MDVFKKEELINIIAEELDITPAMYNEAMGTVDEISEHLKTNLENLKIYKQGSFRLGTIIKPYSKQDDFDIDLVVEYPWKKEYSNPEIIKKSLRRYLQGLKFNTIIDEKRRCWTLNLSKNKISFHVDILPCIRESLQEIAKLKPLEYRESSIAITEIVNKDIKPYEYKWLTSNPEGYAKWFHNINNLAYKTLKEHDKRRVFNSNAEIFGMLQNVGEEYTRSPLQKVIQILKRHRDVMYFNNNENAPISIIITTLVGKIVEENHEIINNTYELLNYVIEGLLFYSKLTLEGIHSNFDEDYKTKRLITKIMKNGNVYWEIVNPANFQENLADKWNEDAVKVQEFFKWVNRVKNDLLDILDLPSHYIIEHLKKCLGEDLVKRVFERFCFEGSTNSKPEIVTFNDKTPKPYRG